MIGSDGIPIPSMFGGGVERHVWELSKCLVKNGVEVHLLTLPVRGHSREEELNGVTIHRGKMASFVDVPFPFAHPSFDIFVMFKVLQRKFTFDIIHAHNGPPGLAVLPSKYLRRKKLVYTEHTSLLSVSPLSRSFFVETGKRFRVSAVLWAEAFLPRLADKVIAISSSVLEGLLKKVGLKRQKIITIPNGVDADQFSPKVNGERVRRTLGWDAHKIVLYVGRVGPGKGLHHLIKAMPAVLKEVSEARLLVVGPYEYFSENGSTKPNEYYFYLKKLSEKLGISDKLSFAGTVLENVLPEYYASCDVYSLPSYGEGLPLTLMEAMSSGKPVITTPCGGTLDVLRDRYNGFLVPIGDEKALADRITMLLTDERLARRMGENGRRLMAHSFSWESIAKKAKGVYEEVLSYS